MVGQGPNVFQDVRRLAALRLVLVVNATILSPVPPSPKDHADGGHSVHTVTRPPGSLPGRSTSLHLEWPVDDRWELGQVPEE